MLVESINSVPVGFPFNYHYLVYVLQRVAVHPAKEVIELTPQRWKERFADKPMTSDVSQNTAANKALT